LSLLGALIFTAGMVLFKNRKSSVLLKVIISMGKYSVFIPLILPALFIFYLTFNVTSFFQDFLNIKLYIPLGGMHSVNYSDLNFIAKAADLMRHLILPGAITGLFHFFIFSDYFYKIFDEINKSMFVLAARARGYSSGLLFLKVILPESLFYIGEALKTSVPIVLNSIIVIEIIFSWPGLGRQIYRALLSDNHLGIAKTLMAWAWISIILKAGIYFFIVFVKFTNFNLQIKGNREQCI
jgi:peptide/nickel transport system permease protein